MEPQYRALVAEDSDTMRQILVDLLKSNGFSDVHQACDGREAMRMLFSGEVEFDALFVDWRMPHVEGIDVVRAARGAGYQLPIMMVTAQTQADEVREAIRAGVNDYLVKPIVAERFTRKVARLQRQMEVRRLGAAFRVKHAMTRNVVSARPTMLAREAAALLLEHRVSGLPVVDADNCLVGIITEFSIVERLFSPAMESVTVAEVMSTDLLVVNEDSLVTEAARMVIDRRLRCVPVVRGRELVGVIARRDLIRFVLDHRASLQKIIEMSLADRMETCGKAGCGGSAATSAFTGLCERTA